MVTVRLRTREALPAAELLLGHVYGKPADWAALAPTTLVHLAVLSRDHALPALEQACAARLLHLLAAKRPPGPPGAQVAAAAATAPAGGSSYIDTLSACLTVPPDVAAGGAFCILHQACRALLADVFQDLDAAWQHAALRDAFHRLPLAAAVELLGGEHLVTMSEGGVLLAALSYDAGRALPSSGVAEDEEEGEGAAAGGGGRKLAAGPLSTSERLALYGTVRWPLMFVDGRAHQRATFLRNALNRLPHLNALLDHGTPSGGAIGGAPHTLAVPELVAAAAACGPHRPAASLPDLAALAHELSYTRLHRMGPAAAGAAALARPLPQGHMQTAAHLHMDVPYEELRRAVGAVAARLDEHRRQERRHGQGPSPPPPLTAVAVEQDIVSPSLVYHNGYFWQMVVSVGPLCRYRLALARPAGGGGGPHASSSAAEAAAAAAAHETDSRLCCYVGVRPLLLLTEAEIAAATGRAVPAAPWGPSSAATGPGPASAPAPLIPTSVYVSTLDVWNERELPLGRAALGPTCFSGKTGFKGSTLLFELGPVLLEEGYWAKVLSAPGELRVRARVAGVH